MNDFDGRVVKYLACHAIIIVVLPHLRWDDNCAQVRLSRRVVFQGHRHSLHLFVSLIRDFPDFCGIEVQNLIDELLIELLQHFLERSVYLLWAHVHFDLRQLSDNWLVLALVNAFERSEHGEHVVTFLIFLDRLHCWIVILLVAKKHVIEQWALAGEERTGDLKRFGVPELAFKFALFLDLGLEVGGARLQQESHLRAHAEVRHDQDGEFAEERVPAQLHLVAALVEELLHGERLDLHDIADIQIVDPLVLVEEAEHAAHVRLLLLVLPLRVLVLRRPLLTFLILKRIRLLLLLFVLLFCRYFRVDDSAANFAHNWVHFER